MGSPYLHLLSQLRPGFVYLVFTVMEGRGTMREERGTVRRGEETGSEGRGTVRGGEETGSEGSRVRGVETGSEERGQEVETGNEGRIKVTYKGHSREEGKRK